MSFLRVSTPVAHAYGSPGWPRIVVENRYAYNGTARLAGIDFTNSFPKLEMFSGTGNYSAWDRFGRTLETKWQRSSTVYDQVNYTYSTVGNLLSRDVAAPSNDTRDQKYTYDSLHRLRTVDRGTWSGSAITNSTLKRYWELDPLGNWSKLRRGLTAATTVIQHREHNAINQITNFVESSTTIDPLYDDAGNATIIPQPLAPNHQPLSQVRRLEPAGRGETRFNGPHGEPVRRSQSENCPRRAGGHRRSARLGRCLWLPLCSPAPDVDAINAVARASAGGITF